MHLRELATGDERVVRNYDYADATVIVADLRLPDDRLDLDVVDGTGIVVVHTEGEDRQYEFDIPSGDVAKAVINNGVVTVEVEK